jgi:Tol biopolymer transport system component
MYKLMMVITLGFTLLQAAQTGNDPEKQLQAAINKEVVEGDLNAAIDLYKQVITNNGNNRAVAAKALLRLGGCYEKLGQDEARKTYERLVQNYADQPEQAREAQSRLAAMEKPAGESQESTFATRLVWEGADGVSRNAPSPDGKYMTYVDWDSGNLAVRDLKAETSRMLTKEGSLYYPYQCAASSRWSHDGKQIAYKWEKESKNGIEDQLRVLPLEDPKPRVIFRGDEYKGGRVEPLDWSPDDKQVLVRISHGGRADQLALIPAKGGTPRVIKEFDEETLSTGVALFSPDGRYVVYNRTPGNVAALDIFLLSMSEDKEIPLIQHPADDQVFGWSPDGNWILFLSHRTGTSSLWVIQVKGGKPQGTPVNVRRSADHITPLGFAKDGSFYYGDVVKEGRDIYTAGIDLETGKLVTPPEKAIEQYEGWNMYPQYSPDGKSLAYISRRGRMALSTNRGDALCIHALESGSERVFMDEFVNLGVSSIAGPRWSPDSRIIAVAGERVIGEKSGFYLVHLDTGKITTLIEMPPNAVVRAHEFARDSNHFFYIRKDTKQAISTIHILDLSNGEDRELYRSGGDFPCGLAISPDGEWLATITHTDTQPRALSVIPSGGGTPRLLHRFPQLSFIVPPEWTPDGKYILVGARTPEMKKGMILYRIPAQGGKTQEMVLQQLFVDRPTVHPDGRRIAFTTEVGFGKGDEIWVMRNFLPPLDR